MAGAKVFLIFFGLLCLFSCQPKEGKPKIVLKLGHQANEQNVWHKSVVYFADLVDSLSSGEIEVRIFHSEQLGKELDMIRSIEVGVDDMTITGESMQNWIEETAFCGMPYLIRDLDHLNQVVGGQIGDRIAQQMIDKMGVRPLAYFARGPRHLTSNRPIKHPEDLKGMILRVPPVNISVKTWEALGAKPTPMTFSEVFTALQQGTIEGQENPFALIYSAGFYEVQQYVNLTGHVIGWVYVIIGEKRFRSLSKKHQEIILKAGRAMQVFHEREFMKQEERLRQLLEEKGMIMVEVDVEAFRKKASDAVIQNISESIKPMYYQIINMPQTHEKDTLLIP